MEIRPVNSTLLYFRGIFVLAREEYQDLTVQSVKFVKRLPQFHPDPFKALSKHLFLHICWWSTYKIITRKTTTWHHLPFTAPSPPLFSTLAFGTFKVKLLLSPRPILLAISAPYPLAIPAPACPHPLSAPQQSPSPSAPALASPWLNPRWWLFLSSPPGGWRLSTLTGCWLLLLLLLLHPVCGRGSYSSHSPLCDRERRFSPIRSGK